MNNPAMTSIITLKDCFKTYTLDQDKAVRPEDTVARARQSFSAKGIDLIKRTERIDNGRLDIPVYVSMCGNDALAVMPTKKQMGKGATPEQAEASAVMEMVERYSFFNFLQNGPIIRAAYDEVADQAMPFEHIAAAVHHPEGDFDRAKKALEGLPLSWVPGYNLTREQECLVPLNWFYEINEFNGPAAGNTIEEAIIQGLCEVVERHVCALVARGRLNTPSIDITTLESETAKDLVNKFQRLGINLYIKDFTLDMGIPTVAALAWDPSTFPESSEIVYTAGTASNPEKALIRALTEVAQLGGDFNTKANFLASGLPKFSETSQADYVINQDSITAIGKLPDISSDNIKVEIERAVSAISQKGQDVYVVNITHPQAGVPAVYNIVPGAHFRERAKGSSVPFFAAKIISQGDPGWASARLEYLKSIYPEGYYINFFKGQILIEQGNYTEAVGILEKALEMNPPKEDMAGILTYLGLALKDMEEYDRAMEVLGKSAELDKDRRDTFNLRGFCRFKTGRHAEAIEDFKQVLRIDPGSAIDYANIGTNYRELGRIDEAISYYKTALELDPTMEWVWENLFKLERPD